MSLWSDYLKECKIMSIVEEPYGFLTYEILGKELWLGDAYIIPEERQSGKLDILLSKAFQDGKEKGCLFICSGINIRNEKVEEALVSHLKRGCKIHSTDENFIYLKRDING